MKMSSKKGSYNLKFYRYINSRFAKQKKGSKASNIMPPINEDQQEYTPGTPVNETESSIAICISEDCSTDLFHCIETHRWKVLIFIILACIAGITVTMTKLDDIRENHKRCFCYKGTPVERENCTVHLNEECGSCDWVGV